MVIGHHKFVANWIRWLIFLVFSLSLSLTHTHTDRQKCIKGFKKVD